MNDTAVSATLVLRKVLLFFQDKDPRLRMLIAHGQSRRQSHDSTPDDYMLMHSSGRRKLAGLFEFRNGIGGDVLNIASTLIQASPVSESMPSPTICTPECANWSDRGRPTYPRPTAQSRSTFLAIIAHNDRSSSRRLCPERRRTFRMKQGFSTSQITFWGRTDRKGIWHVDR